MTVMLFCKLVFLLFIVDSYEQIHRGRLEKLSIPLKWRRRLLEKPRATQICYDVVGCFDSPHMLTPLKKVPESPSSIGTKFYLFRRDVQFSDPQILKYEDSGQSVNSSKIDPNRSVKVIIHGYMGSWLEDGPLNTAQTYLKICDCNVIIVDWETGAKGPQYANAAANTEVVGRQLGILLLHMIKNGLQPDLLHLIGFSLGAHVAGCASEVLKKNEHLVGRITALDAASPLFRHNNFKDKSKKLDKDDAVFVDAIHTDASPFFTDGFGLLEPIGHVDFFPNGGFEQPGCVDRRASVVMTHLERTITKDTACSHLRSWELFLESLQTKLGKIRNCEFTAFKCKSGLESFQNGLCFPDIQGSAKSLLNSSYRTDLGKMGEDAKGDGIMYLVTKNKYPFCGLQLQVGIEMSKKDDVPNGEVRFKMQQENVTASTNIRLSSSRDAFSLLVVDNGFDTNGDITADIAFFKQEDSKENLDQMVIDKVIVKDIKGGRWSYCTKDTTLPHGKSTTILLNPKTC
ncbi:hypothetical protein RN001_011420 [Aquatica leii]|uniref:Lipase domain-containing protein n=1 Tax=Aquatica leii TaxID=1421715 RepID=A0AAN7QDU7_9COLE|nr:hypothetical protein RN001_011420 [Aquatica leii]